jgi:hypothetical protein
VDAPDILGHPLALGVVTGYRHPPRTYRTARDRAVALPGTAAPDRAHAPGCDLEALAHAAGRAIDLIAM